jgi:predicted RecB family nuclease
MALTITNNVLEGYLNCKYKGLLQLEGEEGRKTDYERMVTDLRQELRTQAMAELLVRMGRQGETCQDAILTTEMLKKGFTVIVNATSDEESVSLLYDGLVKVQGDSALGNYHYVPVLCCEGQKIRQVQKHLLAIYGLLLGSIQGKQPASGFLIWKPGRSWTRVKGRLENGLPRWGVVSLPCRHDHRTEALPQ